MTAQADIRTQLCALAQPPYARDDVQQRNHALKQALLTFGSETPDNVNCVQHIEYGVVQHRAYGPQRKYGLKVKGTDVLINDLMNAIEDAADAIVQAAYPALDQDQREAVLRAIMLVLLTFEQHTSTP